jgi:hypothetical protein
MELIKSLKMNMRDYPDVYFFDEGEAIDLQTINGDALIFIGTPDKEKIIQILAVKNHAYYKLKPISDEFLKEFNDDWTIYSLAQEPNRQNLFTQDKKLIKKPPNALDIALRTLAEDLNFPYAQNTITISKDGKSITLSAPEGEEALHPRLRDNLGKKSGFEALNFLQKYGQQLLKEGGLKGEGFILESDNSEGVKGTIRLHDALKLILSSLEPAFKKLSTSIASISSRFFKHPDTSSKRNILNHFETYCYFNWKENLPKKDLIEHWVEDYKKKTKTDENPFTVLMRQRRTGWLSIFNPKLTDSIKLFRELLGKEELPDLLKEAIESKSTHQPKF